MKKTILTLLLVTTVLLSYSQNVLIADNNAGAPTGTHVSATLQEAIDASAAGDIIHVIPSPTTYGTVTITQADLSIIGIGFNPDKDGPAKSTVTTINIHAGNIRISGLDVTTDISIGTTGVTVNNISIDNCQITDIESSTSTTFVGSNVLIRNCIFRGNEFGPIITLSDHISNSVITNCIIGGYQSTSASGGGSITAYNGTIIKNCVFFGDAEDNKDAFHVLANSTVSNCIFFGREPQAQSSMSNVTFNNNVSVGIVNDVIPPQVINGVSGNNNYASISDATTFFEDASIAIGDTWDFTWAPTLTSANASALLGTDGTVIGPDGSTLPWDGTGVSLPLIQSVISSEVIKQGDNLDVTIKARGN